LLCVTGTCGEGSFRALEELKLSIPGDVSLLTFDNYSWTSLVMPKIDVIEQPVDEMGLAAIKYILEEIENPSETILKRRYPGKLITRGSCGPNLKGKRLSPKR
jgi:LacI family transcriptional regulator